MHRRTVLGLLGGAAIGGYFYRDAGASDETPSDRGETGGGGAVNVETEDSSGGDLDDGGDVSNASDFNADEIEQLFLERFNEMRERERVGSVHRDRFLSEMGQDHAENMAEHDYIGHVQPDGWGIEDRYRDRGLLPKCELPVDDGSGRYYPGAENAAGAAVGRVTHPGTDETFNIRDNDDVAEFLMDSWMSSDGHRAVMVLPAVQQIGLGVAIRGDGEIFAALQFC